MRSLALIGWSCLRCHFEEIRVLKASLRSDTLAWDNIIGFRYGEATLRAAFLEGLWPFRPRKFEAQCVRDALRCSGPHARYTDVFNEYIALADSARAALTTSSPFVHTARRSYRLNGPVKCSDRGDVGGSPPATSREVHRTLSFRGRRSRNKVSVGEPAEGSLSCPRKRATREPVGTNTSYTAGRRRRARGLPATETPAPVRQGTEMKARRAVGARNGADLPNSRASCHLKMCIRNDSRQRISRLASMKNVAKCDTWCELRDPVNHRVFERKLRRPGRGHARPGVTQRRQRPILRRGG
ncbi:hypothetical protein K1719_047534 [Acacia pycnantha]|nr:hypothetical protein K1719_047534 [Acacia pycnantha]